MRVPRRRLTVLALIEEQSRLLAVPRIDVVGDARLAHRDGLRHRAVQHFDLLLQSFEQTDLGIVPRQNAFGAGELHQQRHQGRQQAIHALRQRLHHKVVGIAIDDQRRQEIGFAVDQAIRRGVDVEGVAESRSRARAARARTWRRWRRASREIIRRVICDWSLNSAWPSARLRGPNTSTTAPGSRRHVGDVGTIDPRMAAANPVFALRGDDDGARM